MYAADPVWAEELGAAYALKLVPLARKEKVALAVDCEHRSVDAPLVDEASMVLVGIPRTFST
jgi:hypothetical protein